LYRSLNAGDDGTGITPLQLAVEMENVDCIREMILCGASLDTVDKSGRTVFHYAARTSNEMIIQVCPTHTPLLIGNLLELVHLSIWNSVGSEWHKRCMPMLSVVRQTNCIELGLQKLSKITR